MTTIGMGWPKRRGMIDDEDIRYLGDVQRMELKPDDTIVLSTDEVISYERAEHLRDQMSEKFPGHKVLVLSAGMKIGVVGE